MKLGTLVNSRKEQDFWAETIPSKDLQLNSQYCTKKLHKEKGSPSVMASDSSVRSETQDWGRIGRCLFHPWENGNIIKIPSWSRVRECHDLESSDFCPFVPRLMEVDDGFLQASFCVCDFPLPWLLQERLLACLFFKDRFCEHLWAPRRLDSSWLNLCWGDDGNWCATSVEAAESWGPWDGTKAQKRINNTVITHLHVQHVSKLGISGRALSQS